MNISTWNFLSLSLDHRPRFFFFRFWHGTFPGSYRISTGSVITSFLSHIKILLEFSFMNCKWDQEARWKSLSVFRYEYDLQTIVFSVNIFFYFVFREKKTIEVIQRRMVLFYPWLCFRLRAHFFVRVLHYFPSIYVLSL